MRADNPMEKSGDQRPREELLFRCRLFRALGESTSSPGSGRLAATCVYLQARWADGQAHPNLNAWPRYGHGFIPKSGVHPKDFVAMEFKRKMNRMRDQEQNIRRSAGRKGGPAAQAVLF